MQSENEKQGPSGTVKGSGTSKTTAKHSGVSKTTVKHSGVSKKTVKHSGVSKKTVKHSGVSKTTVKHSGVSKEIKQELITASEPIMPDPMKEEEKLGDTVKKDAPKTSIIPQDATKLENNEVSIKGIPENKVEIPENKVEIPVNKVLKKGFKTEQDDVIYIGKSIKPFVIDDDEDDELLYISTTREDANVKAAVSEETDVIVIGEKEPKTNAAINTMDTSVVDGAKRKALDAKHNQSNKKKKQRFEEGSTSKTNTATDKNKSSHTAPNVSGQNTEQIPRKENKQVQTTEILDNSTECKTVIQNKLGFFYYNWRAHLLKYAKDNVTNEEYIFVYRLRDNYIRVYLKHVEYELFLKFFNDLFSSRHAFETTRRRVMTNFQQYISNTMMQRRYALPMPSHIFQYSTTYRFPEWLVRYGNDLIIMAICKRDESRVFIVCPVFNWSMIKLYYYFMSGFSKVAFVYMSSENLIAPFRMQFYQIKRNFLRKMCW